MSDETTELLRVGDILFNEPCDERIVVIAANERNVWLRKVQKNDELAMHDGHVWAMLGKKCNVKNMCTQSYAQTVFELDGHVEQAIAATLGSDTKGCENLLWELVGALDVADATDASKKPIVKEYARRIAATLGSDEPPYDELLRCLENDWHISASWDGLRKFWCIELTEEGVKLRDATHGTLTAEQVSEAIEKRFDFDVWVPPARWQAIADELNAELGNQFTGCGKKVER